MTNHDKNKNEPLQVRFCTKCNNKVPTIQRIFKKNWKILESDLFLKTCLSSHPNLVFRRPKDLRSIIAPSRVKKSKNRGLNNLWTIIFDQKGSYRCGSANCGNCAHLCHRKKDVIGVNGRCHEIKQFISCGTPYVIYGLICSCGLMYVGRTSRQIRTRMNEHRSSISIEKDKCSIQTL